jgi:large subunit ribosomal protein L54
VFQNKVAGSSENNPNLPRNFIEFQLKPKEEYPDWLWTINVGKPLTLEQLDPETKQYWRKLRKLGLKRNNQLAKLRRF